MKHLPNKHIVLFLSLCISAGLLLFLMQSPALAWLQSYEMDNGVRYGFLRGIMHGFLAPFAVIAQLFDKQIILYSPINTGFWYNFGFILGISAVAGGGAKGACRK